MSALRPTAYYRRRILDTGPVTTIVRALPIGHVFDGYRVLRVLGAGGFGITYLTEEVAIGRRVAMKEYLPAGIAAPPRAAPSRSSARYLSPRASPG